MLCLTLYGPEDYKKQYARKSAVAAALAALSGPAIALAYDATGTYAPVMAAGAIACAAMAVFSALLRYINIRRRIFP